MLRTFVTVTSLLFLVAGVACARRQVDRRAYVKANENLFRELPRFPRSRIRKEASSPRVAGEDKPIVGYVTRFELRLSAGTTPVSVARFYERRLRPKWRLVEKLSGPVLNFRRWRALVSINLENFRSGWLEIAVDHAFYA